jgi:hypothetical protein
VSEAGIDAGFDAGFDAVSVWIWISRGPNVRIAAFLVLWIRRETFSGAIPWFNCKEFVDNGYGCVLVIGSSVAVGSEFCEDRCEIESYTVERADTAWLLWRVPPRSHRRSLRQDVVWAW